MKSVKVIIMTGLLSLILVGCGGPSVAQTQNMDFGTKPKNIKVSNLKSAFSDFKDPSSVQIKLTNYPLRRAYMSSGSNLWSGWVTTVEVNGKNSYGAYVGYQDYYVLMNDGKAFMSFKATEAPVLKFVD